MDMRGRGLLVRSPWPYSALQVLEGLEGLEGEGRINFFENCPDCLDQHKKMTTHKIRL